MRTAQVVYDKGPSSLEPSRIKLNIEVQSLALTRRKPQEHYPASDAPENKQNAQSPYPQLKEFFFLFS